MQWWHRTRTLSGSVSVGLVADEPDFCAPLDEGIEVEYWLAPKKGPAQLGNELPPGARLVCALSEPASKQLAGIIRMSARYAAANLRMSCGPTTQDGTVWYAVGHNASHSFYLGEVRGELWVRSVGEGPEGPDGWPQGLDISARPVGDGCYLGHL